MSDDLKREIAIIDTMLGDLKRLTDLIPEFEGEADKYREKRQIVAIGASLASFLLGNILNLDGDSDRLDEIEGRYRLFSKSNLEFEEKQIGVNNELSRQVIRINKDIEKFENEGRKYKVLVDRKNSIKSLMSVLKDSIHRVTKLIKGAINGDVGTIIEFPEKIKKAIETVEKNSRSKAYLRNLGIY